jgi:hypothetical protein
MKCLSYALFFPFMHLLSLDVSQLSAQYLPRLVNAWRANEGALNSHTCMLNLIGSNSHLYFARFVRLPEARGMAALQIKRMASNDFPGNYDSDDLGEIGQFLSTMLMFQGDEDVEPQHKAAVLPTLQSCEEDTEVLFQRKR